VSGDQGQRGLAATPIAPCIWYGIRNATPGASGGREPEGKGAFQHLGPAGLDAPESIFGQFLCVGELERYGLK
jgi:hypothetical protein